MNPTTLQLATVVMPLIFLAATWHGHSLLGRFKALANAAARSAGQP